MSQCVFTPKNDMDFRMGLLFYFDESNNNYGLSKFYDVNLIGKYNDNTRVNISSWNTSCVTNMDNAFKNNTTFNEDISKWNTSCVISMNDMFNNASSFDCDIGQWDTSKVKSMSNMFNGAILFDGNIICWDVSQVINFNGMFLGAHRFNQNISVWNTCSGRNFGYMFMSSYSFRQNIKVWQINESAILTNMFYCAAAMTLEYENDEHFDITPHISFFNDNDSYFIGPSMVLMMGGTTKCIQHVRPGDFVINDINTFQVSEVSENVAFYFNGYCHCIRKKNDDNFILSTSYPACVHKNIHLCPDKDFVHVDDVVYGLQFLEDNSYYINGIKVNSIKPTIKKWSFRKLLSKIKKLI